MPLNKRNLCNNEDLPCVLVTQFSLMLLTFQHDHKREPKKLIPKLSVYSFLFFYLDNFWSYTYFFICGWAVKCVAKHHFKKEKKSLFIKNLSLVFLCVFFLVISLGYCSLSMLQVATTQDFFLVHTHIFLLLCLSCLLGLVG